MRYFLVLIFLLGSSVSAKPQAALITDYLKKKDFVNANRELKSYIQKNPQKKWAYTSRAWALENLKKFDEAISLCEQALGRWPGDNKVNKTLARLLRSKARVEKDGAQRIKLLQRSAQLDEKAYTIFLLGKSHRELGQFEAAIKEFSRGQQKFADYKPFGRALPYTRYLHYKHDAKAGRRAAVKSHIERTVNLIVKNNQYKQWHHRLIVRFGLREYNDRSLFEATYSRLFQALPVDSQLHDDYGFQLYANFRIHNQPSKKLRLKAISYRRKAYKLFWQKHKLPKPVTGLGPPLAGQNLIFSEFGGSAMTHNGYANYCYDFARVDKAKSIKKPASDGSKNSHYYMFGSPVYAVAAGVVDGIVANEPDNKPGGYSGAGNTVSLKHKGFSSFYAHLKQNGVVVKDGQRVKRGQLLGYNGNSGMSSQSHLHFCIYKKIGGERISVPFKFKKVKIKTKSGKIVKSTRPLKEDEVALFSRR